MDDEAFLHALENCVLPAAEFGHSAHVRAAYLYSRSRSWDDALGQMRRSLQRYVSHLGKPERYDERMTAAYIGVIHRRIAECGDAGGWAEFARSHPDLLTQRL